MRHTQYMYILHLYEPLAHFQTIITICSLYQHIIELCRTHFGSLLLKNECRGSLKFQNMSGLILYKTALEKYK